MYGDAGRLTKIESAEHVITRAGYNAAGEVINTTDGAGQTTSYLYDGAGRRSHTVLSDGTYTVADLSLAGQQTATRSFSATDANFASVLHAYDFAGNLVATTDAELHTTRFEYDPTGLLIKQIEPTTSSAVNDIITTYGYDVAGNRTRFTDGRHNEFWTTYNTRNLPESTIEPATAAHPAESQRTYTTAYDAMDRVVSQLAPGGVSITNTYDDMGNLLRQAGSGAEAATDDREFAYDIDNRMIEFSDPTGTKHVTYDNRNLPLTITGGTTGDTTLEWTPDARMDKRTDAAGTTDYDYDLAGRLAMVENTATGTHAEYAYNNQSLLESITYGNNGNVRTFAYHPDSHRLLNDEIKTPGPNGTSLGKITYDWNDNGNLLQKKTTGLGSSTVDNHYTYDFANRLTSWNNGTSTVAYQYDESGNRVQSGTRQFVYDARNRLLSAQTGSGTTSYSYTARGGRQSGTVGTVVYNTASDAFGQVAAQDGPGGSTQTYSYDAFGRAVVPGHKYTGLGNDLAKDASATYVRDPGGAVVGTSSGGAQVNSWTDLHDDVVAQFTSTGGALTGTTAYDPLGAPIGTRSTIGNLGYQSEWTDNQTGRVNMAARWYDPEAGQFDSRDTFSNTPNPSSANANRYGYGNANPLIGKDPSGHVTLCDDYNPKCKPPQTTDTPPPSETPGNDPTPAPSPGQQPGPLVEYKMTTTVTRPDGSAVEITASLTTAVGAQAASRLLTTALATLAAEAAVATEAEVASGGTATPVVVVVGTVVVLLTVVFFLIALGSLGDPEYRDGVRPYPHPGDPIPQPTGKPDPQPTPSPDLRSAASRRYSP